MHLFGHDAFEFISVVFLASMTGYVFGFWAGLTAFLLVGLYLVWQERAGEEP